MSICLRRGRQLEGDAAIIVLFLRDREIEIRECDLSGTARR
jgi:hypothetical protein